MRALVQRVLSIGVALALFTSSASAYYYFVHFNNSSGPFFPMVERFDLNTLQNNTVSFYVSDTGPSGMASGDSFQAILSEIRQAALEWNNISTSTLRLAYGGLYSAGSGQVNSGITVDFTNDLPPGVIALGGPITTGSGNGQFVPILRSTIRVQSDLGQPQSACSNAPCPSYSEYFYTTMVHEFGHTLGLQHTFTSSVMSTYVTSAATKSAPLGLDDIIGVSLLYPSADFTNQMGNITGRVVSGNSGIGMASVVAISTGNPAISTLTNPDGSYTLTVPPGAYQLYVHPLPPPVAAVESTPGNIVPPKDGHGDSLPFPAAAFQTQFYPGTQDFLRAENVYVNPGNTTGPINFSVRTKSFSTIPSVRTYGYSATSIPIASPPIKSSSRAAMVAYGSGLLQNNNTTVSPGLNIAVMASGSDTIAQIYNVQPWYSGYLLMDVSLGYFAGTGPKHLLFRTPDDVYILPSAFTVVTQDPPFISSLGTTYDQSGTKLLVVGGTNLSPGTTRILFDGLPGTVAGTDSSGNLLVVPPAAPGSYRAVITALNSDGQSSNYLQAAAPPTYAYEAAATPSLAVSPAVLSPGSNVVDVQGVNTNFAEGQLAAGFGSSDVVVNKVTVLSATHLSISVTVNSNVFLPATNINVTSGLSVIAQSMGSSISVQQ